MKTKIVTTKLKCPRCKSQSFSVEEYWIGHFITWEVDRGKFDRQGGVLEPGDPNNLSCQCRQCDHRWRVRGAGQIDDIVDLQP